MYSLKVLEVYWLRKQTDINQGVPVSTVHICVGMIILENRTITTQKLWFSVYIIVLAHITQKTQNYPWNGYFNFNSSSYLPTILEGTTQPHKEPISASVVAVVFWLLFYIWWRVWLPLVGLSSSPYLTPLMSQWSPVMIDCRKKCKVVSYQHFNNFLVLVYQCEPVFMHLLCFEFP